MSITPAYREAGACESKLRLTSLSLGIEATLPKNTQAPVDVSPNPLLCGLRLNSPGSKGQCCEHTNLGVTLATDILPRSGGCHPLLR